MTALKVNAPTATTARTGIPVNGGPVVPPAPQMPPTIPRVPAAAPPPRRRWWRSWKVMAPLAGGLLLMLIIGGLLIAGVFSDKNGNLTPVQIITADKPATVMVFTRGATGSPISELNGGGDVLFGGSGWVYDASCGLMVTNAHVVVNGATVQVGFDSSSLTSATIVGVDLADDIALLKAPPALLAGIKTMPRATAVSVTQGDAAYALGFPGNSTTGTNFLKTPFQLTEGTLSALTGVRANVDADVLAIPNSTNTTVILSDLYQTDARSTPATRVGRWSMTTASWSG